MNASSTGETRMGDSRHLVLLRVSSKEGGDMNLTQGSHGGGRRGVEHGAGSRWFALLAVVTFVLTALAGGAVVPRSASADPTPVPSGTVRAWGYSYAGGPTDVPPGSPA